MIKRLVEMNKPVLNDERQNKYCHYKNIFDDLFILVSHEDY
jgi:hypothetical protein